MFEIIEFENLKKKKLQTKIKTRLLFVFYMFSNRANHDWSLFVDFNGKNTQKAILPILCMYVLILLCVCAAISNQHNRQFEHDSRFSDNIEIRILSRFLVESFDPRF